MKKKVIMGGLSGWLSMAFAALSAAGERGVEFGVAALTEEQVREYELDTAFFKKGTVVQGILIATSGRISDYAITESAYLFDRIMGSIEAEVAERIREKKVLCILVGHDEFTSDIPQFKTDKTGKELDFYNWRQRGFLRRIDGRPVVLFAEEDVLEYEGGMQLESILIHEFGHVIHGAGFDEAQQRRLTEAFGKAKARLLWNDGRAAQRFRRIESARPVSLLDALVDAFPDQPRGFLAKCLDGGDILVNGEPADSKVEVTKEDKVLIVFGGRKGCYAGKNRAEYFAEGVQCWYDTNRTMDHDHNHIHTREGLKKYDPGLAKLCEEVLGNDPWRFVSPRERAGKGHLEGFDPEKAPVVEDLKHIKDAANDYYDAYWSSYWERLRTKHGYLATADPGADEEGFVPIFDGKTLAGWEETPPSETKAWEVKDGVIVGEGGKGRGYLVYEDHELADFELKFSYRFPGDGNSGVNIRATPDETGKRDFKSYHADLGHLGIGKQVNGAWDFHTPGRREHACFRGDRLVIDKDDNPTVTKIEGAVTEADINKGGWNEAHVIAKGNHFHFSINGKPASEFTEHLPDEKRLHKGMIQLQLHDPGMVVMFKDLRLKVSR